MRQYVIFVNEIYVYNDLVITPSIVIPVNKIPKYF